jgi:hypothetical protein
MSQPGRYDYGEEWEAEETFTGEREPVHPLDETPEMAAEVEEEPLPPDPAIDERDLLDEPPS